MQPNTKPLKLLLVISLTLFTSALWAQNDSNVIAHSDTLQKPKAVRPKVGLVLSGGGAKGMAHIVKGTIIAVVPIAVPIKALVKGNKNTTNKMNGMLLNMSIRRFKKKLTVLLGINPPGLVSLVREPKTIAIENEINKETKDM